MDNGWIKLHRKSLESIIFTNEKGWKIWTWCLLKANHDKNEFFLGRSKISLKSGQFVMGRNTASQELGLAVGTIWYWLDILEKEGNIERKSTNKYTIITILKWEQYQIVERRLNADRTQIEQQIEPNKNDKNVKNDKNNPKGLVQAQTYGNENINKIIAHLTEIQGIQQLDGSVKWNRIYAKNLLSKFKGDTDKVLKFIDYALLDPFHQKNATSLKYLYNNLNKIALTYKNNQIATI